MRDFKNLKPFQETQINHILDEHKAKDQRLKPIRDYLSKYYVTEEIWEVNDFQIAKVYGRDDVKKECKEIMYVTFMNYESLAQCAMSFDQALLICLAYKYDNHSSQFPIYAERMLNAKFEPEFK